MATQLMPPRSSSQPRTATQPPDAPPRRGEPTVVDIITAARSVPAQAPARGAWFLSGMTALLLWASFTPLDWGPLGWIALVPLLLLVRIEEPTRWMSRAVYLTSLAGTLATLQWMRLGDAWMYPAWILLSLYLALSVPLFVALARRAVHRLGVPLTLAVPVVWVALEYVQAHFLTGFAWYYLGHTQHRWIELIQVSDLVGVYGVSFVVAAASACLAGLMPSSLLARLRLFPPGRRPSGELPQTRRRQAVSVAACLVLVFAVLVYGNVRRGQAGFEEGPRVALVQGNFVSSLKHDPHERGHIYRMHEFLTGRAVPHQPDLIVWPETMFRWPLFVADPALSDADLQRISPDVPVEVWRDPTVRETLADLSQRAGAALVIGIDTAVADPEGFRAYNSAAFVRPDAGLAGRYDKLHRVVFGEYIPLREQLPWLARLTPFPPDFGIAKGESAVVFRHRNWRFAPIICFEDTVPHLVRRIVKGSIASGGRPVDCLVNLTNDGWFHGSSELDQHLATAVFRAVECRTPMVRAVNTGISAIIDGDGVVVEPAVFFDADGQGRDSMRDPRTGRYHKSLNALLVNDVPLDNRRSLYVAWGDWFAALCLILTACVLASGPLGRRRAPRGGPPDRDRASSPDSSTAGQEKGLGPGC